MIIGVVGWRTWRLDHVGLGMKLWWAQMAFNFAWSPIFFSAHQMGLALCVIAAMLATIATFIIVSWRRDPIAARLFLPYCAWVSFATVLNGALFDLN